MKNLPHGWTRCRVSELFQSFSGGTPSKSKPEYWSGSIPWISSGEFNSNVITKGTEFINATALKNSSAKLCRPGSVIVVVRSGILKHTLPVGLVGRQLAINQDIKCFDSSNDDLNRWLFLSLRNSANAILNLNREGTTVQSVKYDTLKEHELLVPPVNEQRRIGAKVEKLLNRVNAVQERLATIPRTLKHFRQSVLSSACTGRLTVDIRERVNGTETLPSSWSLVRFGTLIERGPQNGLYKPQSCYGAGIPIVRIDAFYDGAISSWQELKRLNLTLKESQQFALAEGDILINRVNSPKFLGKSALIRDIPETSVYESNVMRLSLKTAQAHPEYAILYLRSAQGLEELRKNAKHAVNQSSINQEDVRNVLFALPPPDEQREIVRRVDALFKTAGVLEARYTKAKAHVDKLAQSILAKAFRGELVPQDPNDEPASVLLERIKSESNESAAVKRRSRG